MMPMVPVIISANGKTAQTYAILDTGSDTTTFSAELARKISLRGPKESSPISVMRVGFQISSSFDTNTEEFDIKHAMMLDTLSLTRCGIDAEKLTNTWPHLANVPVSSTSEKDVGVLIGLDNPAIHEVFELRKDPLQPRAPRAIRTPCGWSFVGPSFPHKESAHDTTASSFHTSSDEQCSERNC